MKYQASCLKSGAKPERLAMANCAEKDVLEMVKVLLGVSWDQASCDFCTGAVVGGHLLPRVP